MNWKQKKLQGLEFIGNEGIPRKSVIMRTKASPITRQKQHDSYVNFDIHDINETFMETLENQNYLLWV